MAKYINKSKLLGKIGTENYRVSDCPVHLPKEKIGKKLFMNLLYIMFLKNLEKH